MNIQAVAKQIKEKILENVAKGIDRFGQPFIPYSEKPFKMPYASAMRAGVSKDDINDKTKANIFTKKWRGKNWLWVTWLGGYKQYRRLIKKQTEPVNLNINGYMLKNIYARAESIRSFFEVDMSEFDSNLIGKLVVDIPEFDVIIGFSETKAEKIALNNILRAREFLGLTDKEVNEILEIYLKELE